jgi:hypothetical protein
MKQERFDSLSNGRVSLDKNIISEFLAEIGSKNVVIAFITIWSKENEKGTGLLDEKNKWVENFADCIVSEFRDCWVSRELWNSLFLAFPSNSIYEVENRLTLILEELCDINLEIYGVMSLLYGNLDEKIRQMDEMLSSISTKRNFQEYQGSLVRFFNGMKL